MAVMKSTLFVLVTLCLSMNGVFGNEREDCLPKQVHIAYGATVKEMVIMWSTIGKCSTEVRFGEEPWNPSSVVPGTHDRLPDLLPQVPYLHRVVLGNLKEDTTYYYSPYSNYSSTGPFFFKTPFQGSAWEPEFMVYGDLGIQSKSFPLLKTEALKGVYSAILHVGDFGYSLFQNTEDGQNVGDIFMTEIEEMASHVPYMVSPGNHEIENDTFNHYRYRFSMPNTNWPIPLEQMWYSIDIGPVHFISYSSEVFFIAGGQYIASQREWLMKDLERANKERHTRPWVVAFGHRPMYCSNDDGDDCTKDESKVREGLEDLFYTSGVDVVLQAHEHSYERLWPVYKGVVLARNYTNPQAPIQLITGAAGSKYKIDPMSPKNESWSAFRMDNRSYTSYGRLKVYNATHLFWEQVAVFGGEVLDSIWIVQESHGPFTQTGLEPDQKEQIIEKIKIEEVKKQEDAKKTKPSTAGDSITETVTKAIKGADMKVVIGVSFGVFVVLFLLVVCLVRRCHRKRPISYRRWENVDYGKKFYTNLKNEDKDGDDFEADVTDGTTKLIED